MAKSLAVRTLTSSSSRLMIGSLAISTAFVILLCLLLEPRWETNDDIAMSMAAHGYGIAGIGSPNLIFSNVLWGYLVRAIPGINGTVGYSIATIGVLVIVGTTVLYGLFRFGIKWPSALPVFVLLLARPVLFPQFTINAGLLAVGSIIYWSLYVKCKQLHTLVSG